MRPALAALVPFYAIIEAVGDDTESGTRGRHQRVSQRTAKWLKRAAQVLAVEVKVFANLDVAVPTAKPEAVELAGRLLDDQAKLLKVSIVHSANG